MLRVEATTRVGALELDVALSIEPGRCLALAGPSGSGKTSTLRVAAGLRHPARGRVECGGEVWLDTEAGVDLPPERRRCGYLFQEYALFPHMSAWRNVAYPLRELPRAERRSRALELLGRFGLADRAEERPESLSGGERQRVALARAVARRPDAFLLDEPLSALDPATRAAAGRELAAALRETAAPALLVTHSFEEAALFGDRVAVLDRGRVVQEGTPAELAAEPRSGFVADLTGAVVLSGVARTRSDGLTEVELDGGGRVVSSERAEGAVAATLHPWDVTLDDPGRAAATGSARNRLTGPVVAVTPLGNRVRVTVATPQAITAEITPEAAAALGVRSGGEAVASFKATAVRLLPR
jgi:molybdate transport system ATP-binding protein